MVINLFGVLADGSEPAGSIAPAEPTVQHIRWPRAESGVINLLVFKADRTVADLTAGSISFVARRHYHDEEPSIEIDATLTDAANGVAEVAIAIDDTNDLIVDTYRYDIQYTDVDGVRWQIIPASDFEILEIIG